jgi:hypothetical protein
MASIEPAEGATCEGALYTLTRDGYEALWQSEGGSMPRPGYEEIVDALTLRAAPWMRMRRDAPPSQRYKQLILDGARELGLSEAYVAQLAELRAASPSAALTAIAKAHGVIAVLLFRLKLRNALAPLRAATYALLRSRPTGEGLASRVHDVAAELAIGLLLLPTAALGAIIRVVLQWCGKGSWVQFGPPPSKPKPSGGAGAP